MKEIRYDNVVDKSIWGEGPWQNEPDKMQWPDASTGLPCLIVRGPVGALCGYVGVPSTHPAFGKDYDDVSAEDGGYIEVHGGLTFCGPCNPKARESHGICHRVEKNEDDNIWWFGFDCSHYNDLVPMKHKALADMGHYERFPREASGEVYRTVEYVKNECAALAAQLINIKQPLLVAM